MKTTISDPWGGTREIGDTAVDLIRDQLRVLKNMRDDGRVPTEHLLQDIRIYEFILSRPDPEKSAGEYLKTMNRLRDQHGIRAKKIDAVKILNWDIQ